jgi:hypothetical protein
MSDEHTIRMKIADILAFLTSNERTDEKMSKLREKLEETEGIMNAEVAA